jgi:hypothetical protein
MKVAVLIDERMRTSFDGFFGLASGMPFSILIPLLMALALYRNPYSRRCGLI